MSNIHKPLGGQYPLLILLAAAVITVLSTIPTQVHAGCVELQTYPPQVMCTNDSGGTGIAGGGSSSQDSSFAPIAFWKFDESDSSTTLDSSGNGNGGTLENGATRYVGTQQGNKLLLDGVDDRVTISPASANASNMSAITVMAWVRPTTNGGIILRKGNTSIARFNLGIDSQGRLYLRAGYSGQSGAWTTMSTLPLNAWSHVAVTYSVGTSNDPVFYINAAQAQSTETEAPAGDIVADTPYIYLGNNHDLVNRAQDGFSSGFSGRMDNIRIYSAALPGAAVAAAKTPEPDASLYTPMPFPNVTVPATTGTNASAIASLQVQLNALLAQIASLQGMTQVATSSRNAVCPTLTRNLSRDSRGDDVKQLQQYLIAQGFLSAGNDTGYYGALTEAAVMQWQSAHGIDPIGVVGPRTRAAIAANCS